MQSRSASDRQNRRTSVHTPPACKSEECIFTAGLWHCVMGRDSSVGIATRYGLDGPGIESRCGGRDFPHPSRPALGAHPASYTTCTGSFPGVKRPGSGAKRRGHERVGLYLYSASGPQWPVVRRTNIWHNINIRRFRITKPMLWLWMLLMWGHSQLPEDEVNPCTGTSSHISSSHLISLLMRNTSLGCHVASQSR